MVMDYSEKRTARGEAVERKPVQKNRPRKEPVGMFALLSVAVLLVTFGAGVGTGWFLFKTTHKTPPPAAVAQPAKKEEAAAATQQQEPPPDAPLTFYKTLPAGGKGAMGSGLNLKKPDAAHPAPAPAPAPAAAPAAQAQPDSQPRFVVQVASYRDKKEAEAAQAKMATKGVAAYLVESKVADKGVWYRLRVGKHLSKAEADELAAKSGKGAITLPE